MHLALEAVDGGCRRRRFPWWWRGRTGAALHIDEAGGELAHLSLETVNRRGEGVEGGRRNGRRGGRIGMRRRGTGRSQSGGERRCGAVGCEQNGRSGDGGECGGGGGCEVPRHRSSC